MSTYNVLVNKNQLLSVITLKDKSNRLFKFIIPMTLSEKVISYLKDIFKEVTFYNFLETRLVSNDKEIYFLTGDKLNNQDQFVKNIDLKLKVENLFNNILNNKEFNETDQFYLKNLYDLTISFILFQNR